MRTERREGREEEEREGTSLRVADDEGAEETRRGKRSAIE